MDELMKQESSAMLSPEQTQMISIVVRDVMAPLMESIGQMLRHNTEAMEQIAAAQQLTSERMAELEKRVRLQTPLSKTQEKYVNDCVKQRARALLDPKGAAGDRKAVSKLGGLIRRAILTRYGVSALRECPAYDYNTILNMIGMWNDFIAVRDVAKEAKAREAEAVGAAEPAEN